jgi:outer membrane protein assembly factor BamB
VCFIKKDKQMVALDIPTGEVKWSRKLSTNITNMIPEWDHLYFVENKWEGLYLWALDAQDGSTKWATLVSAQSKANLSLKVTQRHIIALANRYSRGYTSTVVILDRFSGQKVKEQDSFETGGTYTEMCISGGLLWLVKNNTIWAYGE